MDGQIRPRVPTADKPRMRVVDAPCGGVHWRCTGGGVGAYGRDMDSAIASWLAGRRSLDAARSALADTARGAA